MVATPFLQWQPSAAASGGVAQAELGSWQMLRAFGRRISVATNPPDLVVARNTNLLTLKLQGPSWTRILNEYLGSGLLTSPMASLPELDRRLALRDAPSDTMPDARVRGRRYPGEVERILDKRKKD